LTEQSADSGLFLQQLPFSLQCDLLLLGSAIKKPGPQLLIYASRVSRPQEVTWKILHLLLYIPKVTTTARADEPTGNDQMEKPLFFGYESFETKTIANRLLFASVRHKDGLIPFPEHPALYQQ
jgi:hypothetical protein